MIDLIIQVITWLVMKVCAIDETAGISVNQGLGGHSSRRLGDEMT